MQYPAINSTAPRGSPTHVHASVSAHVDAPFQTDIAYLEERIRQLQVQLEETLAPLLSGFIRLELHDLQEQLAERYHAHLRRAEPELTIPSEALPQLPPQRQRHRPLIHQQVVARARHVGLRQALADLAHTAG